MFDYNIQLMPTISTPQDIGQTIRSRRKQLGWDQAKLADQVGVSRQWIINIEQGKPRAEIGLILRTLHVLNLPIYIGTVSNTEVADKKTSSKYNSVDIDDIVDRLKTPQAAFQKLSELQKTIIPDHIKKLMDIQKKATESIDPIYQIQKSKSK